MVDKQLLPERANKRGLTPNGIYELNANGRRYLGAGRPANTAPSFLGRCRGCLEGGKRMDDTTLADRPQRGVRALKIFPAPVIDPRPGRATVLARVSLELVFGEFRIRIYSAQWGRDALGQEWLQMPSFVRIPAPGFAAFETAALAAIHARVARLTAAQKPQTQIG